MYRIVILCQMCNEEIGSINHFTAQGLVEAWGSIGIVSKSLTGKCSKGCPETSVTVFQIYDEENKCIIGYDEVKSRAN